MDKKNSIQDIFVRTLRVFDIIVLWFIVVISVPVVKELFTYSYAYDYVFSNYLNESDISLMGILLGLLVSLIVFYIYSQIIRVIWYIWTWNYWSLTGNIKTISELRSKILWKALVCTLTLICLWNLTLFEGFTSSYNATLSIEDRDKINSKIDEFSRKDFTTLSWEVRALTVEENREQEILRDIQRELLLHDQYRWYERTSYLLSLKQKTYRDLGIHINITNYPNTFRFYFYAAWFLLLPIVISWIFIKITYSIIEWNSKLENQE